MRLGRAEPVGDFVSSWSSGLAFSALLHRHDRYLLPHFPRLAEELLRDAALPAAERSRSAAAAALRQAFEVAEKYLNIPEVLDPEDLLSVDKPDETIVLACIMGWYSTLSRIQRTPEWQEMDAARWREAAPMSVTEDALRQWQAVRGVEAHDKAESSRLVPAASETVGAPEVSGQADRDDDGHPSHSPIPEAPEGSVSVAEDAPCAPEEEASETVGAPEVSGQADRDDDGHPSHSPIREAPEGTVSVAEDAPCAPEEEGEVKSEFSKEVAGSGSEGDASSGDDKHRTHSPIREAPEGSVSVAEDEPCAPEEDGEVKSEVSKEVAGSSSEGDASRALANELDDWLATSKELRVELAEVARDVSSVLDAGVRDTEKFDVLQEELSGIQEVATAAMQEALDLLAKVTREGPLPCRALEGAVENVRACIIDLEGDSEAAEVLGRKVVDLMPIPEFPCPPVTASPHDHANSPSLCPPALEATPSSPAASLGTEAIKDAAESGPRLDCEAAEVLGRKVVDSMPKPEIHCSPVTASPHDHANNSSLCPPALDVTPSAPAAPFGTEAIKDAAESGLSLVEASDPPRPNNVGVVADWTARADSYMKECETLSGRMRAAAMDVLWRPRAVDKRWHDQKIARCDAAEAEARDLLGSCEKLDAEIEVALGEGRELRGRLEACNALDDDDDRAALAAQVESVLQRLESAIFTALKSAREFTHLPAQTRTALDFEGKAERFSLSITAVESAIAAVPVYHPDNVTPAAKSAGFSHTVYEALRKVELELERLASRVDDMEEHRAAIAPLSKSILLLPAEAVAEFDADLGRTLAVPRNRLYVAYGTAAKVAERARAGIVPQSKRRRPADVATEASQLMQRITRRLETLESLSSSSSSSLPAERRNAELIDCYSQIETMVKPRLSALDGQEGHAELVARLDRLEALRLAVDNQRAPQEPVATHRRSPSRASLRTSAASNGGGKGRRRSILSWMERKLVRGGKRRS